MSTCYKFTANTAAEAASAVRERLGENARVLSVRTDNTRAFSPRRSRTAEAASAAVLAVNL